MKRTFLLALLLTFGSAQASEWVSVGKSADGTQEVFADVSSLRVGGGMRWAWFKTVFASHTSRGAGDAAGKWESYSLGHLGFDCDAASYRVEAITYYYDDGTVKNVPAKLFPTPWMPVPPDSLTDGEIHFICSWKPT